MKLELLTNLGSLLTLEEQWRNLASANAKSVFQMPGWIIPWWNTFASEKLELFCIAVYNATDMVGFAPLMLSTHDKIRTLQFIGTPLNDYNGFLARQDLRKDVHGCILRQLLATRKWDRFEAFVIEEFEDAIGIGLQSSFGFRFQVLESEPVSMICLPSSWETYLTCLSKDRQRYFKHLKRRLWRDEDPIFEVYTSTKEISKYIDSFESNRLESWRYRNRLTDLLPTIRSAQFTHFLELIINQLPTTNGLRFAILKKKDDSVIASGLYFSAHYRLLAYMQSWDHTYAHLSPGTILHWLMMEYAIQHHYSIYDFGRGDESYKFRFGAKLYEFQNAYVFRD